MESQTSLPLSPTTSGGEPQANPQRPPSSPTSSNGEPHANPQRPPSSPTTTSGAEPAEPPANFQRDLLLYADARQHDQFARPGPEYVDESGEDQWLVETVLGSRRAAQNGHFIEYLVLYNGWPAATWQPLADVLDCLDLVEDFHSRYPRAVQPRKLDWAAAFQQRPEHSGWLDLMGSEEAQALLHEWLEWVRNEGYIGDESYEELVVGFVQSLIRLFPELAWTNLVLRLGSDSDSGER